MVATESIFRRLRGRNSWQGAKTSALSHVQAPPESIVVQPPIGRGASSVKVSSSVGKSSSFCAAYCTSHMRTTGGHFSLRVSHNDENDTLFSVAPRLRQNPSTNTEVELVVRT